MATAKSSTSSAKKSSKPVVPDIVTEQIPPLSEFDNYIPRVLPSGLTDIETLAHYYNKRKPVRLEGPTGVGKTQLVVALAAHLQVPLWQLECAGDDDSKALFGQTAPVIQPNGQEQLVYGEGVITLAARYGGILYLDEDNFTDPSITGALHSLLDFRRRLKVKGHFIPFTDSDGTVRYVEEVLVAHPDLWVVGASNPNYEGTVRHNQAFRNRFQPLAFEYDRYVESHFVPSVLLDFADAIRFNKETIWSPFGMNRLVDFHNDLDTVSWEHAVYALLSYFEPEEQAVITNLLEDSFKEQIGAAYGIDFTDDDSASL